MSRFSQSDLLTMNEVDLDEKKKGGVASKKHTPMKRIMAPKKAKHGDLPKSASSHEKTPGTPTYRKNPDKNKGEKPELPESIQNEKLKSAMETIREVIEENAQALGELEGDAREYVDTFDSFLSDVDDIISGKTESISERRRPRDDEEPTDDEEDMEDEEPTDEVTEARKRRIAPEILPKEPEDEESTDDEDVTEARRKSSPEEEPEDDEPTDDEDDSEEVTEKGASGPKTTVTDSHRHRFHVDENGDGETSSDAQHLHTIKGGTVQQASGHTHQLLM